MLYVVIISDSRSLSLCTGTLLHETIFFYLILTKEASVDQPVQLLCYRLTSRDFFLISGKDYHLNFSPKPPDWHCGWGGAGAGGGFSQAPIHWQQKWRAGVT